MPTPEELDKAAKIAEACAEVAKKEEAEEQEAITALVANYRAVDKVAVGLLRLQRCLVMPECSRGEPIEDETQVAINKAIRAGAVTMEFLFASIRGE